MYFWEIMMPSQKKTEEEVIRIIRAGQGDRSLRDYAREIGISAAYLSEIYAGTRSPGRKCLVYFDITKKRTVMIEYEYFARRKG